jgi:hypothetical protein
MKTLLIIISVAISLMACNAPQQYYFKDANGKPFNLKKGDTFYHQYGYGVNKMFVVDTMSNGVYFSHIDASPENVLDFITYDDLLSDPKFRLIARSNDSIVVISSSIQTRTKK